MAVIFSLRSVFLLRLALLVRRTLAAGAAELLDLQLVLLLLAALEVVIFVLAGRAGQHEGHPVGGQTLSPGAAPGDPPDAVVESPAFDDFHGF